MEYFVSMFLFIVISVSISFRLEGEYLCSQFQISHRVKLVLGHHPILHANELILFISVELTTCMIFSNYQAKMTTMHKSFFTVFSSFSWRSESFKVIDSIKNDLSL